MSYNCPVCGVADEHAYLRCNHPACTDGRDRPRESCGGLRRSSPNYIVSPHEVVRIARADLTKPRKPWVSILLALGLAAALAATFYIGKANAMNHGFDPDAAATKWFERQMMPDHPMSPCCGTADAYPVDRYEKLGDGSYKVWIADGRPIKYPDGTHRDEWDISIPVIVPKMKVNKEDDDLDNPTEHGWIFMRPSSPTMVGAIFCFIRHPQGS